MNEKFIEYLKGCRIYSEFKREYARGSNKETFNQYLKTTPPEDYIMCAFVWRETRRGVGHWAEFNAGWWSYGKFDIAVVEDENE